MLFYEMVIEMQPQQMVCECKHYKYLNLREGKAGAKMAFETSICTNNGNEGNKYCDWMAMQGRIDVQVSAMAVRG